MTCTLHVAWDERLTDYHFGPGHPMAPVRVELTMRLAHEFGLWSQSGVTVAVPAPAGLTGTQRAGADACVRYLTSKHDYLRYDQALAAGWPIATGVIEGVCRHLIGDRLDITGARWGLQGAEAVLTLRAVIANGDFDQHWRYHLAREHQRLYPGTEQGQYTLSA
jgi:hypothetical protein